MVDDNRCLAFGLGEEGTSREGTRLSVRQLDRQLRLRAVVQDQTYWLFSCSPDRVSHAYHPA